MEKGKSPSNIAEKFKKFNQGVILASYYPETILDDDLHRYEDDYAGGASLSSGVEGRIRKIEEDLEKGKMSEGKARIRKAEYRAIGYLYGDRDKTLRTSLPENPLVDVLTLISGRNDKSVGIEPGGFYQLAVEGPPEPEERVIGKTLAIKNEQYSYEKSKLGKKREFRTLSRFDKFQRTVARTMYLFAYVNDRYPEILRSTLDEYVDTVAGGEGDTAGMAVGMLELLYNLDLIQDLRFSNLSKSLRDVVMTDVEDFGTLKSEYFYKVIRYSPFWLEGENRIKSERSVLYGSDKTLVAEEESRSLVLPRLDQWDGQVRKLAEDQRTIAELTPVSSITRTALASDRTLETLTADLRETLRKRAELVEAVGFQTRALPSELRKIWGEWLRTISEGRKTTPSDSESMSAAITLILKSFAPDRNFSRKSLGLAGSEGDLYKIDPEKLLSDPLFNWIFALRDEKLAAEIEKAAKVRPAETSLLFRLMVYEAAAKFFRKKEIKFLLDPHFREKTDPDSMVRIVQGLRDLVNRHRPDIREIFQGALSLGDKPIADLMEPKRMKRVSKNLKSLTYHEPVPLVKIDKSKVWTRRSFLKLIKNVAISTAIFSLEGGALGLLYKSLHDQAEMEAGTPSNSDTLKNNASGFKTDAYKRAPEALTPNELKGLKPFFYGYLLNLPRKYFSGDYAEEVGYFPTELTVAGGSDFFNVDTKRSPFQKVLIVDSLDKASLQFSPDQLVIRPDKLADVTIPPTGWRIVSVVQEGGDKPDIGELGEVYFSGKGSPLKAQFVMEKISGSEMVDIYSGISLRKNVISQSFVYPFRPDRAKLLNDALAKDPLLQKLHKDFVEEIGSAWSGEDGVSVASAIAIKYTDLYREYTRKNRYYALGFSVEGQFSDSDWPSLEAISRNPDKGYYCRVASQAYQEFMMSGGIVALIQPGFSLQGLGDQLWGSIAHQNNVTILPNGNVMYVDMTPPATDKTPKEDVDALSPKIPGKTEVQKQLDIKTIMKSSAKYGVGTGLVVATLLAGREISGRTKEKLAQRYVDSFLSETRDLSEFEKEILSSTVSKLAYAPYNEDFYEQASNALDLLNQFSPQRHGAIIQWLISEQPALLHDNSKEEAFQELAKYYRENLDTLKPEFTRYHFDDIAEGSTRPFDFDISFELASYLERERLGILKREVYGRIGVDTGEEQAASQAQYKAGDILSMIEERLFDDAFRKQHMIRTESSAYYQALHKTLSSLSEI